MTSMYSARSSLAPSRAGTPPPEDEEIDHISIINSIRSAAPSAAPSPTSSRSSSSARNGRKEKREETPTNSLIITPLPLIFFNPNILDALRSHFASFSTVFFNRPIPQSEPAVLAPFSSSGGGDMQDPEGDLYSWVPLKGMRRILVAYYTKEDAERARIASDRLYIPETPNSPAVILRAFRGPQTVLPTDGPGGRVYEDPDENDEGVVVESPYHLRPPAVERNFLISPPGSPPVGWVQTEEEPPNDVPLASDIQRALEQLQLEQMGDDEEGIILVPESEVGVCVRVQNWSNKRRVIPKDEANEKREKGEDFDPLDEELEPIYEEVSVEPENSRNSRKGSRSPVIKPLPASMPPLPPSGLGGGLMSPAGHVKLVPTGRPPLPPS